ncbi:unnamed protein product, partial [Polarella glacialis]
SRGSRDSLRARPPKKHLRVTGLTAAALAFTVPSTWVPAEATVAGRCESSEPDAAYASRFWPDRLSCIAALASASSRVEVDGMAAHVFTNFSYVNDLTHAIEAPTLTLPLPAGAVLTGFNIEVHGRSSVRGQVVLRSHAASPPQCPKPPSSGSPGLYEAVTTPAPSSAGFAVPLGRLEAGDRVSLQLGYVQELRAKSRPGFSAALQLQLALPAGAKRRPSGVATQTAAEAAAAVPMLTAEVVVSNEQAASEVSSPTLGVSLEVSCTEAASAALQTSAKLRSQTLQDVTLEIARASTSSSAEFDPELIVQRHAETGMLAAALWLPPAGPTVDTSGESYEVVLVLDRSLSMKGVRLGRVRQAARTILRSIPTGARINLVGFSADALEGSVSAPAALFPTSSRALDEEVFREVEKHLLSDSSDSVQRPSRGPGRGANGPGTLAQELLRAALDGLQRPEGAQLRVFLITDRHPSDAND